MCKISFKVLRFPQSYRPWSDNEGSHHTLTTASPGGLRAALGDQRGEVGL